jgi:hypothetical protein
VNSACNTRAAPIECFTFSILAAWRYYWSGATSQATTDGMRRAYRWRIGFYDNYLSEIEEEDNAKDDKVQ